MVDVEALNIVVVPPHAMWSKVLLMEFINILVQCARHPAELHFSSSDVYRDCCNTGAAIHEFEHSGMHHPKRLILTLPYAFEEFKVLLATLLLNTPLRQCRALCGNCICLVCIASL